MLVPKLTNFHDELETTVTARKQKLPTIKKRKERKKWILAVKQIIIIVVIFFGFLQTK